jgi:hypothetical protein
VTDDHSTRMVWAMVIMAAALLAGGAVGLLSWWGGLIGPQALLSAMGSFGGAATFGFTVFDFVTGHRANAWRTRWHCQGPDTRPRPASRPLWTCECPGATRPPSDYRRTESICTR